MHITCVNTTITIKLLGFFLVFVCWILPNRTVLVSIVLSGGCGGGGKEEKRKKRRKRGKTPTTADLNVPLIKMSCTQEENHEPRKAFLLFFALFSLSCHADLLLLLRPHVFPFISPRFSFFFVSGFTHSSPPSVWFMPLLGQRGPLFICKRYSKERFASSQGGKEGYCTEMS